MLFRSVVSRPAPPFSGPQLQTITGKAALAQYDEEWPPGPRTMRHALTNLRLTRLAEDRVAAVMTWTGYRYEGEGVSIALPMAIGDYDDEFVRETDGRWLIQRRRIIIAFLNQQLLEAAAATIENAK